MCMLAGCDYLPSVPGLGIKTAHRLVRQHRTPERLLRALAAGSAGLPEASVLPPRFTERYRHARLAFRHQARARRARRESREPRARRRSVRGAARPPSACPPDSETRRAPSLSQVQRLQQLQNYERRKMWPLLGR